MPINTIPIGRPFAMVQNTVYALPNRRVLLFADTAAPTFFQSETAAFTVSVAVTLTGGQAELSGQFLRVTSAGPVNVTLKAA